MNSITMKVDDLLTFVKGNLEGHVETFEKAWEAYSKHVLSRMEMNLARAKEGRGFELYINAEEPQSHERDYHRVMGMLEHHTETTIEVTAEEYASYVQDDWKWKRQWAVTNTSYGVNE